jgi:hypothetical protein
MTASSFFDAGHVEPRRLQSAEEAAVAAADVEHTLARGCADSRDQADHPFGLAIDAHGVLV